ncbi:MAG: GGDEF domain-containing protein [Gammaproteobacteria bacterium]|nr:GGDEF domain-containing protein [Gammaproteobacteria bacterium]
MAQNETQADNPSAAKRMLGLLDGLKQTSLGTVIYDQVARLVQEQEDVQARINHAYVSMMHLLLEAYAREPSADQVTRIQASLIQLHHANGAASAAGAAGDALNEKIQQAVSDRQQESADKPEEKATPPDFAEPAASPLAPDAPRFDFVNSKNGSPQVERRVNSVYRLHLERKRDEIDKLQNELAKSVTEAVTQNREFGALLQIELRALQQADGSGEIENLRQILIGGLEELIQSQRLLNSKLHRTGGYLRLIKADSERLHNELNKVRLLSLTDEFTGLANRRAFMRRLQDEISRAQRYGLPLALAMVDLDEFKAINDLHGHAAGDAILRTYATDVLTVLCHHDMVARYGGEEFAILMPNTNREGAASAINKVKNRISQIQCEYEGKNLPLPTFSTGISFYSAGETHTDLIDRADRALYQAKRLGRNRIELDLFTPAPTADLAPDTSHDNGV